MQSDLPIHTPRDNIVSRCNVLLATPTIEDPQSPIFTTFFSGTRSLARQLDINATHISPHLISGLVAHNESLAQLDKEYVSKRKTNHSEQLHRKSSTT